MENSAEQNQIEPLNELEEKLFACLNGELSREEFLGTFLWAPVYIMVDGEPVGDVLGDRKPLVVANAPEAPRLMAVFSDPSRAEKMMEYFGEYNFPILVNTPWVLHVIGTKMGISFNPGFPFGFEIAPEGAQQLKTALEEAKHSAQP